MSINQNLYSWSHGECHKKHLFIRTFSLSWLTSFYLFTNLKKVTCQTYFWNSVPRAGRRHTYIFAYTIVGTIFFVVTSLAVLEKTENRILLTNAWDVHLQWTVPEIFVIYPSEETSGINGKRTKTRGKHALIQWLHPRSHFSDCRLVFHFKVLFLSWKKFKYATFQTRGNQITKLVCRGSGGKWFQQLKSLMSRI